MPVPVTVDEVDAVVGRELAHQRGDVGGGVAVAGARTDVPVLGGARRPGRRLAAGRRPCRARLPGAACWAAGRGGGLLLAARTRPAALGSGLGGRSPAPAGRPRALGPAAGSALRLGRAAWAAAAATADATDDREVGAHRHRLVLLDEDRRERAGHGEGISVSTLSVETSRRGSSTATSSPSCFSHRVTVPSVTDSPSAGIVTVVPSPDPTRGAGCRWMPSAVRRPAAAGRCLAPAAASAWRLRPAACGSAGSWPPSSPACATASPSDWSDTSSLGPASPAAVRTAHHRSPATRRGRAVTDDREVGADRHRVVLLDEDLLQRAGHRRGDLGVDLVGRDLEQRLVDLDAVADTLQPARHGPFGDGLAERRHLHAF